MNPPRIVSCRPIALSLAFLSISETMFTCCIVWWYNTSLVGNERRDYFDSNELGMYRYVCLICFICSHACCMHGGFSKMHGFFAIVYNRMVPCLQTLLSSYIYLPTCCWWEIAVLCCVFACLQASLFLILHDVDIYMHYTFVPACWHFVAYHPSQLHINWSCMHFMAAPAASL